MHHPVRQSRLHVGFPHHLEADSAVQVHDVGLRVEGQREMAPVGEQACQQQLRKPFAATVPPHRHPAEPEWAQEESADTTLLFRYSALTFNGHRIHYDAPYAHSEEGYPGLVVHGPLTATLLQMFAREHGGRSLAGFDFRGVAPLFANRPFHLEAGRQDTDTLAVWARGHHGELAMSAVARLR